MDSGFFPNDARFYYKKISGNRTLYRSIVDNKVVARGNIPVNILKDIKTLEDMKLDNSDKIRDVSDKISKYEEHIRRYKKYIVKLEEDLSSMEEIEIKEGDPCNFYYKRKINGVQPTIYSYKGYISIEDMKLKKELFNENSYSRVSSKCRKAFPSEDIIDEIGPFDKYYTFLSKREEIKVSLEVIEEVRKSIISLREQLKVLKDSSGSYRKEDIINEYFRLKKEYETEMNLAYMKNYEDIVNRRKYSHNVPPSEEKMREEARARLEAERRRQEMLREKLEKERLKREKEKIVKEENVSPPTFLEKLGIKDKASWRKWLLKNHPDRAGAQNTEICQRVIEAGRLVGY